ncbi:hypothetical protein BVC80_8987g19 [Macleaya cordata]|uniref:Uncharacterized protein n=1 Tax=Macleaya cordata TaxID=56857 RepID=A0A200QJI7_MACCD|nr:hypothetical protein BVC80_8987g19 [Macleaya cordata]
MNLLMMNKRPYGYTRMEIEDPEDLKHRKAQFMIYKVMQQADFKKNTKQSASNLRVRICRLKVRIGNKLKRLRKSMLFNISVVRVCVCKQFMGQLKNWKGLIIGNRQNLPMNSTLPSHFLN